MTLTPAAIADWTAGLLEASGLNPNHAADAADVYTRATLRGLGHHDLSYLPQRLGWLASNAVNPRPALARISASPGTEVWEGDGGLGEVLCYHALRRAITLASDTGLGYAGVRNSNHFLAAEPYTQVGAEQGFLILVWSNTDAGMAFPGQSARQIGNNPLGWGVGTGHATLSADLCMAYSSLGNLNALAASGTPAPTHWGRGPDGQPTTDPKQLLAGAVEPIGGHKGLALALLGEVLAGVLTGGPTLDQVAPGGGLRTHNQMILAFDLEVFGGISTVEARLVSLKARAHHAGHTLRLPGDRSHAAAVRGKAEGIKVPPELEKTLREWSEKLRVNVPTSAEKS
jgi:LDH2 family malate/lactate/ureidoglycolate dehydrogenase